MTQEQAEGTPVAPASGNEGAIPGPRQRKSSLRTGLVVGGIAFACLCLCAGVAAFTFGGAIVQSVIERPNVEAKLDQLMTLMSDRDASGAYELFSTRAQRTVAESDLEGMLEGANWQLFSGYQSVTINTVTISTVANTNPDVPQGLVATVEAVVEYDDGYRGTLSATLEKEDGAWKFDGFQVNVPPEKIAP